MDLLPHLGLGSGSHSRSYEKAGYTSRGSIRSAGSGLRSHYGGMRQRMIASGCSAPLWLPGGNDTPCRPSAVHRATVVLGARTRARLEDIFEASRDQGQGQS